MTNNQARELADVLVERGYSDDHLGAQIHICYWAYGQSIDDESFVGILDQQDGFKAQQDLRPRPKLSQNMIFLQRVSRQDAYELANALVRARFCDNLANAENAIDRWDKAGVIDSEIGNAVVKYQRFKSGLGDSEWSDYYESEMAKMDKWLWSARGYRISPNEPPPTYQESQKTSG